MSDSLPMKREAFLRALKSYARKNGLSFHWDASTGKGGHGRVHVGDAFTTVKSGKLGTGLIQAMLKQLGLPKDAV